LALFTTTSFPIQALIDQIDLGAIGLPELQRPFVWPNKNVRNLFDSLYRGYPAGFLLFWKIGVDTSLKGIGSKNSHSVPSLAIVDGQQRLTSLYAVFKGEEILRADFKKERIRIAFNPLNQSFEVTDAAIVKDKSYISDISELWKPDLDLFKFAESYISELSKIRSLSDEQISDAKSAINKLKQLPNYQFVGLELSQNVDAETIAEVFVRINGEGKKLNQSDFIMTLMSVFWDEGRSELEKFASDSTKPSVSASSPFNHFIKPAPDQLLRVTVGLALKRARLSNVYSVLRGRDALTGLDDPEKRMQQFALLQSAQVKTLNLANWHHFLSALTLAGYSDERMISSQTAVMYCYVIYLIGIYDYKINKTDMRQAISEFYFMASLTGRYTSSPETRFESDLGLIKDLPDNDAFLSKLSEICGTTLTSDFWTITLPNQLATSAAVSPTLFAYHAALVKLDAFALYSQLKISSLIAPEVKSTRSPVERHHLFPREYLKSIGITDIKQINQIANYALVEWPDNLVIGAKSPSEYVPVFDQKLTANQREKSDFWHALPSFWWLLPYDQFLKDRREKMAKVIHEAWKTLTGNLPSDEPLKLSAIELINAGESDVIEFKSTLRTNLHTQKYDEKMEFAVVRTIAGFLNGQGGTLLIGIADNGDAVGLDFDKFASEDKMSLHLGNLIKDKIGDTYFPYIHSHFDDFQDQRILSVRCEKCAKPAYIRDNTQQRFFVRSGNSTSELTGGSIVEYVKLRFGN